MSPETRIEIVIHGVRWATNIMTELISNHSRIMPPKARDALSTAISALNEMNHEMRLSNEAPKETPKVLASTPIPPRCH